MHLLCLKNVAIEGLGFFEEVCRARGVDVDTRELEHGDAVPLSAEGYDAVVVLGGPMNVYEEERYPYLRPEPPLIQDAIERDCAVLGMCLGSQLIAKASGAKVTKASSKEIGWHPVEFAREASEDPLFKHLVSAPRFFQWHGDTFELPDNASLLASSGVCKNQAFRLKDRVYALQFHLEVTLPMIREWIGAYDAELKSLKGMVDADAILREAPTRLDDLKERCEKFFGAFLDLAR